MIETKFTSGPYIKGTNGMILAKFKNGEDEYWSPIAYCQSAFNVPETEKNQSLFIAAPDLYQELEMQLKFLKLIDSGNKSILRIEKLLSKARGEHE